MFLFKKCEKKNIWFCFQVTSLGVLLIYLHTCVLAVALYQKKSTTLRLYSIVLLSVCTEPHSNNKRLVSLQVLALQNINNVNVIEVNPFQTHLYTFVCVYRWHIWCLCVTVRRPLLGYNALPVLCCCVYIFLHQSTMLHYNVIITVPI